MNQADHLKRCGLVPPKILALAEEYLYGKGAPAAAIQTESIESIEPKDEMAELRLKIAEIQNEMSELKAIQITNRGAAGMRGERGIEGQRGLSSTVPGPRGLQGERGLPGESITGPRGLAGKDGVGIPGPQGLQGLPGESIVGPAGKDGLPGKDGRDGESIVGPQGTQGPQGIQGDVFAAEAAALIVIKSELAKFKNGFGLKRLIVNTFRRQ